MSFFRTLEAQKATDHFKSIYKMSSYSWLGRMQPMNVEAVVPTGYHITTPEGPAFLDKKEVEEPLQPGESVNVLVYHDYSGFLTATTQEPYIQTGEFKALRIKAAGDKGAFADWGLEKDLFIPHAEQLEAVEKGRTYVMYAYIDDQSGRITASTRVDRFARDTVEDEDREGFPEAGTEVPLLISRRTDLGYKAIMLTEPPRSGTLYQNEIFQKLYPGLKVTGYIKQLRDDGKIDLTLRKPGYNEVIAASEELHRKLQEADDQFLPFHDKSDAEAVRAEFGMSKRTFKAAVGALLKQGVLNIEENGIRLNYELPDA